MQKQASPVDLSCHNLASEGKMSEAVLSRSASSTHLSRKSTKQLWNTICSFRKSAHFIDFYISLVTWHACNFIMFVSRHNSHPTPQLHVSFAFCDSRQQMVCFNPVHSLAPLSPVPLMPPVALVPVISSSVVTCSTLPSTNADASDRLDSHSFNSLRSGKKQLNSIPNCYTSFH